MYKQLGEDTAEAADSNLPKGYSIPYAIMLNNKNHREERRMVQLQCLSSQEIITCDGALLSWRWLNICLPMGRNEFIPYFALLA